MKTFGIYWLMGCALVGAATAHHMQRCPLDPIFQDQKSDYLIAAAIWPALVVTSIFAPKRPPAACEVAIPQ